MPICRRIEFSAPTRLTSFLDRLGRAASVSRGRLWEAELRQMLEAVAVSGPATRAELRDVIEQRGGRFSGRAVAEAIRQGLIRQFSQPGEALGMADVEASMIAEEAYVLTREGAVALGVDKDAHP